MDAQRKLYNSGIMGIRLMCTRSSLFGKKEKWIVKRRGTIRGFKINFYIIVD